jgi:CBS domain-containing protein
MGSRKRWRSCFMLTAKDIMTKDPITFTPEMEVVQAARILVEKRINGAPVVDRAGRIKGILCQSDLITAQKKIRLPSVFTLLDGLIPLGTQSFDREMEKLTAAQVSQAMTPDPMTVTPDTTIEEIATMMVERKFHTVPVVENNRLVGVVGKEDVLRTLLSGMAQE